MEWSWKAFLIALPICTIISMFSRGAMNDQNVARHGLKADYRLNPGKAMFGSLVAGAVWAALITGAIGLF